MSNDQDNAAGTGLARPTAAQLSWQDMEVGMFFHFDMATYAPGWDFRSWKDLPDPNLYKKMLTVMYIYGILVS